jgi:UTP--glucose-1-phosphate uridylyltransferase
LKKPTKAIIAAAGLGTRFLPQTKAMPKEMLPIIDKPVIQIIVEQLVASGVQDIIIVTGSTKRAIEDHFDRSDELENELRSRGKNELAEQIKEIAEMANFIYVRQKGEIKGNALPLLNAAHLLSPDEPFYYFFADDFFRCQVPQAQQLFELYKETGDCVISLIKVSLEETKRYGMADVNKIGNRKYKIKQLIEKPGPQKTPSIFGTAGGYLITPEIMPLVEKLSPGHGGELVFPDAINQLAKQGKVSGKLIDGIYHDAGDKFSYLKAVIDHALADKVLRPKLEKFIRSRLAQK